MISNREIAIELSEQGEQEENQKDLFHERQL